MCCLFFLGTFHKCLVSCNWPITFEYWLEALGRWWGSSAAGFYCRGRGETPGISLWDHQTSVWSSFFLGWRVFSKRNPPSSAWQPSSCGEPGGSGEKHFAYLPFSVWGFGLRSIHAVSGTRRCTAHTSRTCEPLVFSCAVSGRGTVCGSENTLFHDFQLILQLPASNILKSPCLVRKTLQWTPRSPSDFLSIP